MYNIIIPVTQIFQLSLMMYTNKSLYNLCYSKIPIDMDTALLQACF